MSSARRAAVKGGRFTPKGTAAPAKGPKGNSKDKSGPAKSTGATKPGEPKIPAYAQSGRYTPPTHHEAEVVHETKPWVVPLLGVFLILGMLLIVNYYVGVLPGGRSGYYLLGGLGAITGGFAVATQLR